MSPWCLIRIEMWPHNKRQHVWVTNSLRQHYSTARAASDPFFEGCESIVKAAAGEKRSYLLGMSESTIEHSTIIAGQ